jgi:hypothetical protein
MPLVTVRFDRLFDIVRWSGEGEVSVSFGFEYQGRKHYGITIPVDCELREGMVVTAYLERDGDWQSWRGWRLHATGEIQLPGMIAHVVMPFFLLPVLAVALFGVAGDWAIHAIGVAFSLMLSFTAYRLRQHSKIRSLLETAVSAAPET